jgi:hypothetical protein
VPRTCKEEAPIVVDEPVIEGRYAQLGPYTVGFETFRQDADPAPLFIGLPNDRCQCPHWGVVRAGKLTIRYEGHEETYVEGDAYYAAPGHLPLVFAGTELVEFSPSQLLEATMTVVGANMTADHAASL